MATAPLTRGEGQHEPDGYPSQLHNFEDTVQKAVFCIKDGLDRLIRFHPVVGSPWANWAHRQRLRTVGYILPWLAIWTLILLTFIETPMWCLRDPSTCDPRSSQSELYPRVTSRFVGRAPALTTEFIALSVLAVDYILQIIAEGLLVVTCRPWARGFWHQMLLGASFLSLVISALFPSPWTFRVAPFLRILFLATYSRRLRQEIQLIVRILPQFGKALVLLLSFFLVYAILGLSLFSSTSKNKADAQEAALYFPNFRGAITSVWNLFLYWTFPNMMVLRDPETGRYLPPNVVLTLWVFSFMIIVIYFVLNLALAIVVDVYNEQNREREKRRKMDRQVSMAQAFSLLAVPSGLPPHGSSGQVEAWAAVEDSLMMPATNDPFFRPLASVARSSFVGASASMSTPTAVSSPALPSSTAPVQAVPGHVMRQALLLLSTFSSVPRLTAHTLDLLLGNLTKGDDGWVRKASFMRLPDLLAAVSRKQNHRQPGMHRHHYHRRQQKHHGERTIAQGAYVHAGAGGEEGGEDEEEDGGGEEDEGEGRMRFVDLWCPRLASSRIFAYVSVFVQSAFLEYFIDAVIIANLALAIAANGNGAPPSSPGPTPAPDLTSTTVRTLFTMGADFQGAVEEGAASKETLLSHRDFSFMAAGIFTLEAVAKLFVYGWKQYVASYMNLFDATLTLLTVGGAIYEVVGSCGGTGHQGSQFHQPFLVFELLRILRLFRALMAIPQFRSTGHAFLKILPSASSLFLNLFAVTFLFAACGLEIYGGLVNTDPARPQLSVLTPTYYYENGLFLFNFNDLGGGFIILVEILIDSSLIQPFYEAFGALVEGNGAGARVGTLIFFVLYYCIGQLVVLNIVVAFILDAFMYESEKEEEGLEEKRASRRAMRRQPEGGELSREKGSL